MSGVRASRYSVGMEVFASAQKQFGTLGPTGTDGVIRAEGLEGSGMDHTFRFSKPGYSVASAEVLFVSVP
jgi:hypothetical protein